MDQPSPLQTTHSDIESCILCFGVGGVAAVLFNITEPAAR